MAVQCIPYIETDVNNAGKSSPSHHSSHKARSSLIQKRKSDDHKIAIVRLHIECAIPCVKAFAILDFIYADLISFIDHILDLIFFLCNWSMDVIQARQIKKMHKIVNLFQ